MEMRFVPLAFTLLLVILPVVTGCALTLNQPVNRFESSEVSGRRGQISMGGALSSRASQAVYSKDVELFEPNVNDPKYESTDSLLVRANFGLNEKMDFGLKYSDNGLAFAQVRYQPLGVTRVRAHEGDFSLTTGASLGFWSTSHSGTSFLSTYTIDSLTTFTGYELSVAPGYRIFDDWLVYVAPFYARTGLSGSWKQTKISDKTVIERNYSGNATSSGVNVGTEFFSGPRFSVTVEAGYAHNRAGNSSESVGSIGLMLALGERRSTAPDAGIKVTPLPKRDAELENGSAEPAAKSPE